MYFAKVEEAILSLTVLMAAIISFAGTPTSDPVVPSKRYMSSLPTESPITRSARVWPCFSKPLPSADSSVLMISSSGSPFFAGVTQIPKRRVVFVSTAASKAPVGSSVVPCSLQVNKRALLKGIGVERFCDKLKPAWKSAAFLTFAALPQNAP